MVRPSELQRCDESTLVGSHGRDEDTAWESEQCDADSGISLEGSDQDTAAKVQSGDEDECVELPVRAVLGQQCWYCNAPESDDHDMI